MTNKPMLSAERVKFLVELLGGVAGAAFRVADDSEERDEEGSRIHVVGGADFDVLERALDACDELPDLDDNYVRDGWLRALDELRALLDNPEQPPVADLLLASAHSYVKVAGETQNLARHLQSRIEVYFDGEPAARRQGEPVAWNVCWADTGEYYFTSRKADRAAKLIADPEFKVVPLYAEQPAPVAILLPDRMVKTDRSSDEYDMCADAHNDCLDAVARLNGVKP